MVNQNGSYHFLAVFTSERTTKYRPVFHPSSKGQDGLSFNEHLEGDPNFINSLCDVLAAWRWNEVAFTGNATCARCSIKCWCIQTTKFITGFCGGVRQLIH